MKIKRERLLNDLQDFAARGNGVIIGSPGVGKTYLLKALYRSLESLEIPVFILPIDQLGDGTDKTLRKELSYEGDLIERLKSVPVSDQKAILLFDAFDAARDEQTRKNFLRLIRSAIQELKGIWNVVVTVRTYDAKKSHELLDLFGSPDDTEYQSESVLCRHFTIPPFNEDEILQALNQIGCPESIYNDGSQDFKNILENPFNLWLLERILKVSQELPDFSQIHSEVQLLGLFWQRRVENEVSEIVLRRIADQMVQERSLSVRVDELYEDVDLDKPVRKAAWDKLQSDEILAKISSSGLRIAFSHNILFDYAISVLLTEDEPKRLERFISEDPSRPLFLRPSLTYFFTHLWYHNSETFWRVFWHIFPSNQSVHLRLVARLIPTSVIASEARKVEDLAPILEKLQNGEEIVNEAITRLLQALQTLQIRRDALWSEFFGQVSECLHANFAWDLAKLTSEILERAIASENAEIIKICGRIGRGLLEWVWQERETDENGWYNRLGGYWAVPLVAKTYHTNVEESRALLEKVLQLTKEENFSIGFLSWLTEHVNSIWAHDPKFVVSIYRTVFTYYELSDIRTSFGSSSVMPMTSTRRQDYSMCQYRLVKHFPNFLQAAPLDATQAAIQSLNFFIVIEHIARYLKDGVTLNDMVETFNFRGKPAYFVEDGSRIWDARNSSDEPIEMADALFEFIRELAVSEDPRLDLLLNVFCHEVIVAFFWKRLLKNGAELPEVFAPRLFELCLAKPILLRPDVSYELCLFLEAAAPEFMPDQLLQIEKSILSLSSKATDKNHRSLFEEKRNSLLAQIPMSLLCTDEAKGIREKMKSKNDVPENNPPVSFSTSWGVVTEEKWLQTQGVDTTTPQNQELQRLSGPLNKFSSDWLNEVPTQEAARLVLSQLQAVYVTLKNHTEADKEVINLLWRNLTGCVAILGRIADNLESESFAFCRQVLLDAAKHEDPQPNPESDDQFDHPGYSQFPRHEAARGLLNLAFYQPDAEILGAIEALAGDPVPSVRMVVAMELAMVYVKVPERFWHIMDNRAVNEQNHVVQEYLYFTLTRVVAKRKENEDKTTRVMAKLLHHTPLPRRKQGLSDPFVNLLVWLAIDRQNSWAVKTIEDVFFKNPIQFANILTRLISQVMKNYIVPKHLKASEESERRDRAIRWVSKIVTVVSNEIEELCATLEEQRNEEGEEKLRDTYTVIDQVITRLYYEIAHGRTQTEKSKKEVPDNLRCRFYDEVKPLMQQVINFAQEEEYGIMFAPTAHYFMQLLTSFLSCNPKEVLHLATGVVKSSEPFGYNLDAIAVRDVVEFVEIILADHRDEVREGEALEDLLNLLDMFAKTGWTDALKLVWRLDEVFR